MRATAAESMRLAEIAIALKAVASTEGHLPAAHPRLRSISRQWPQTTSHLAPLPLCELSLRQTDSPPCRVTTPALRARRLSIPPLGPPPSGDLGRPILNTQGPPAPAIPAIDPEVERIVQEAEEARTSHLFAPTSTRERPTLSSPSPTAVEQRAAPANGAG